MPERKSYVPALGLHSLTSLYDPLIRHWGAAASIRRSVLRSLDLEPGMRVLELGAGPGRLAIELKRSHRDVTIEAVDIDERMLASARRNAAAAGVEIRFHEGDMTSLPDLGQFDRVYSTMTFHHLLPNAKQLGLLEACRVLAPQGRFVVADFGRPSDFLQWALFSWVQQPLDGVANTQPHRDGLFEQALRDAFRQVDKAQQWRTVAGTIELFVCTP